MRSLNFIKISLILFSLVFGLVSCNESMDYKNYFNHFSQFNENSFLEVESNGYVYQLQYRPKEYQSVNELKMDPSICSSKIKEEMNKFGNGLDFCLRISSSIHEDVLEKNLSDQSGYYDRIAKLNMDFPQVIAGIDNKDTLLCQFHHFERAYKVQPFIQVLFSLNGNEEALPNKIVFNDVIFNDGNTIEFNEFKMYYDQLPKLKI